MEGYILLLAVLVSVVGGWFNKFIGGIVGALITAVLAVMGSAVYSSGAPEAAVLLFGAQIPEQIFIILIALLYLINGWLIFTSEDFKRRIGALDSTTLALIPLLIAINIAGGQLAKALRLPIYLDSIGTVMAGALLGPWGGMLTGLLSNTIWTLIGLDSFAYAFAIVAGVIGLIAGLAGRAGFFLRQSPPWLSALIGGVFLFALSLFVMIFVTAMPTPTPEDPTARTLLSLPDLLGQYPLVFIGALVLGAAAGYFVLKNAGYAGLAGLVTGVVAALISAPIVTYLFGGLTGSGTDVLVAAFLATGANVLASALAQGTTSDPFDKMTSFMIVYFIIQSLPRRLLQRFPNAQPAKEPMPVTRPATSR
jgi:hypothetical protein